MKKLPAFSVLLIFSILAAFRSAPDSLQRLKDTVEAVQNDDAITGGLLSVCVMRTDTALVVFESNSQKLMMPASTLKILTTGAALGLLGSDYRYETKIEGGNYDSTTGIVRGNLWIRGSGDPSLASQYFSSKTDTSLAVRWASALRKKGVRKIEGAVIADASRFEENPLPSGYIWGDMGNYYAAGVYGLNWRDNSYSLFFNSGAAGTSCTYSKMEPLIEGLKISGSVKASGNKDEAYIYGTPYSDWHIVSGTIPPLRTDYEVEGSMPDPALVCARELRQALISAGITVKDSATTLRIAGNAGKTFTDKCRVLYVHQSEPLSKIVFWTNRRSDNKYAESLLKTLSLKRVSEGDDAVGVQVVSDYWKSKGVDVAGLLMSDGSGLSRSNLLTTGIQAEMLRLVRAEKWSDDFYASLPVAGDNLCNGTIAENNLRAKSGYITRARGYAGYVTAKSGKMLAYSVLANNYTCSPAEMKKKLEKILVKIAELE